MLKEKFNRIKKNFDRMTSCFDRQLDEIIEKMRKKANQHLAGLLHQAQQSRLATEEDVETETTEGAEADRAKHGDSSSVRVEDGPTSLTCFGKIVGPVLAPEKFIVDALVGEDAEAL